MSYVPKMAAISGSLNTFKRSFIISALVCILLHGKCVDTTETTVVTTSTTNSTSLADTTAHTTTILSLSVTTTLSTTNSSSALPSVQTPTNSTTNTTPATPATEANTSAAATTTAATTTTTTAATTTTTAAATTAAATTITTTQPTTTNSIKASSSSTTATVLTTLSSIVINPVSSNVNDTTPSTSSTTSSVENSTISVTVTTPNMSSSASTSDFSVSTTPSTHTPSSSSGVSSSGSSSTQSTSDVSPNASSSTPRTSAGSLSSSSPITQSTSSGSSSTSSPVTTNPCTDIICGNGRCEHRENVTHCVCNPGYSGDNCSTDINECETSPCKNGATCNDFINMYNCTCAPGYEGTNCTEDIDECKSNPCQNGATCKNLINMYNCSCVAGYIGTNCEKEINECESNPCKNGATCNDLINVYNCTCAAGYKGTNCTEEIDECESKPCKNGATCNDFINMYNCTCVAGYTGTNCETEIDECNSNPCQNGATCNNFLNMYNCTCAAGYTGSNCETDIDECETSPCKNGATCIDLINMYNCTCAAGYEGTNCTIDINDCIGVVCKNNGTCVDKVNDYVCNCLSEWEGKDCDIDVDECAKNTHKCNLNAYCNNTKGGYNCTCRKGFVGDGRNCTDIDECAQNSTCTNNGTCYNFPGSYRCFCQTGWTDSACDKDINECESNPCAKNSTCSNTNGSYNCKCDNGFRGDGHVKCVQETIIHVDVSAISELTGDDNLTKPISLPNNIYYYGTPYNKFYVSMNGYLTFGRPLNQRYPIDNREWQRLQFPIIAPFWSDIETSGPSSSLKIYTVQDKDSLTKIGNAMDMKTPSMSVVCTWTKAVPYPFVQNSAYEAADFQVILSAVGSETYVIFNYDQEKFTWERSTDKKVAVGFSKESYQRHLLFDSSTFDEANKNHSQDFSKIPGRWIYNVTSATPSYEFECKQDMKRLDSTITSIKSLLEPCPCSLMQAQRDRRFMIQGESTTESVKKYISRFERGPYKALQQCHYSPSGSLLKDHPNGGYPKFDNATDAYNICCKTSQTCSLFYKTNPSDTCSGYKPPALSLSWGDPHITTLDGATYTFNGKGEYTLLKSNQSGSITNVQVRTDYALPNNTDATVFVGVAARDEKNNTIEIILDRTTNTSLIYINGVKNASYGLDLILGKMIIQKENETYVLLGFESNFFVEITIGNILDIVVSSGQKSGANQQTCGLLGNNNGDSSDDYRPRTNFSNPLSNNSNEEQLFINFGQTWMVDVLESLFNYKVSGGNHSYYNNITTPSVFLSDKNLTEMEEYIRLNCPSGNINISRCEGSKACLVDAAATCNQDFGLASQKTNLTSIGDREKIDHMPPNFTLPESIYIGYNWNKTIVLEFDVGTTTVAFNTSIDSGAYLHNNSYFAWNVSEKLRNETVYIRIFANDSIGASAEYWPKIIYCGCQEEHQCDYTHLDDDGPVKERFYRARCSCLQNQTGTFCQMALLEPCYGNTDRVNGSCKCPDGLQGDGLRCWDENECYLNKSNCDQLCYNTNGSYNCGCRQGFKLDTDKRTCIDEDECLSRNNSCNPDTEYCENTVGSYTCKCLPGYTRNNSICINVKDLKNAYAGTLVCKTPETNETKIMAVIQKVLGDDIFKDIVEVINASKATEGRFKRDVKYEKYRSTFIVYSSSSNETSLKHDFDAFVKSSSGIDGDGYFLASADIPLMISKDGFKIISHDEGGVCLIPAKIVCDPISTNCSATNGGYQCICKNGFEGWENPYRSCKDINECLSGDKCVGDGTCENIPGSFICHCPKGHMYDGSRTCKDLCDLNPCKNSGQCVHGDNEGQYLCKCDDKWTGPNCENENSEAQMLKTVAIAVGASLGAVCLLLMFGLLGMYRRHKNRYSGYSRRPLSAYDFDSTMNFGQTELRTKDFPIDDENSTSFSIPRPQIVNENKYQLAESVKTYDNAAEGDTGKMEEPKQPLTKQSEKAPANGAENPSFLHSPALEGDRKSSKRQSKNPYEYF